MQTYGGEEVWLHAFLTSALDEDEWLASGPGRFTPKERAPRPSGQEAGWVPEPSNIFQYYQQYFWGKLKLSLLSDLL
jgi:hypothetical protein